MKASENSAYPDHPRAAVGAVAVKDNSVLLVLRGKPPSKGVWAIPGGSVNLGETLQEAAEREILEETGIVIKAGKPVFTFDFVERDNTGRVRFHYIIVDLMAEYVSGEPCPGDDALNAKWISPQELDELNVSLMTRRLLKQLIPAFADIK
ncbi:MAG: NUDIX hydrolase [Desulfobacteraceae bacterium]|nr:NUDIX hydrolase [Desulfobacteraceae bacterium]